jgi:arginyl-tRNA synthetase
MSKRRGRYITLDKILEEARQRAWKEVETKSPELSSNVKLSIAKAIGNGAVKYALISVAPTKQVTFHWDKVLNFEMNSAPFIQYAYARASNILRKVDCKLNKIEYDTLLLNSEHKLIQKIAGFPELFVEVSKKLTINSIAEYANNLGATFNSFYASVPVLQAQSVETRNARLALVKAVKITINNVMALLGIDVLERM